MKVLLIDDEADLLEALSEEVVAHGHQALTATSGAEAAPHIRVGELGLVISDLKLQGETGIEILKSFRAEGLTLPPYVFLTGFASKQFAIEALRLGAYDVLEKPHDPQDFSRVIAAAERLSHPDRKDGNATARATCENGARSDASATESALQAMLAAAQILHSGGFLKTNLSLLVRGFYSLKSATGITQPVWGSLALAGLDLTSALRISPDSITERDLQLISGAVQALSALFHHTNPGECPPSPELVDAINAAASRFEAGPKSDQQKTA